jgi:hypothetical protein
VKTIAFACFFWMPEKWDFNFVSDFLLVFYVVFHKKCAENRRNSVQTSFFCDVLDK